MSGAGAGAVGGDGASRAASRLTAPCRDRTVSGLAAPAAGGLRRPCRGAAACFLREGGGVPGLGPAVCGASRLGEGAWREHSRQARQEDLVASFFKVLHFFIFSFGLVL